jgi:hypothetical protein
MTEEEKQEEISQPQDPNIVYRPIEVEVNLLRRKIDRLVFLALIVAMAGCGFLGMKWNSSKKAGNQIALKSRQMEQEVQQKLIPSLQRQGQILGAIITKLDELRMEDPKVAEMWNEMKLGQLIQPQQQATTAEDTGDE